MTKIRTYQKAEIHGQTREICRKVNERDGRNWLTVQSVVQVERVRDTPEGYLFQIPDSAKTANDWVLTERFVDWDKGGEVMGANRIIASTAHMTHHQLHYALRSWMWGQGYMLDFGPSHCDYDNGDEFRCSETRADDDWYRSVMLPEWRRRYLS